MVFEAFKAGSITSLPRGEPGEMGQPTTTFPPSSRATWCKSEIPHQRPSGIEGFVFNTRKPLFADWRVREALIQAFNFEFINQTLNGGVQPRIPSYFSQLAPWR